MIQAQKSCNILVVEDAYLVGLQLKQDVESLGYGVIGPVSSVSNAMSLIERNPISGAVLDVNLGHEDSMPIASRLAEEGVPFLFISGYESVSVDGTEFHERKLLKKPVLLDDIREALQQLPDKQ